MPTSAVTCASTPSPTSTVRSPQGAGAGARGENPATLLLTIARRTASSPAIGIPTEP